MRKATISIVGAGNLGSALAVRLREAGYGIDEIVCRGASGARQKRTARFAAAVGAKLVTLKGAELTADVLWLAVPDGVIARCARDVAKHGFHGRVVLHSSGALASDELGALRKQGAAVASVHPMMSFVKGEAPSLRSVLFSMEGDREAVKTATTIVRDLGGVPFTIAKKAKPLYHAFGAFTSPLLIAHFAAAEALAMKAGVPRGDVQKAMRPIVTRTLENYFRDGAARSFSGPMVRGDVETIRKHLAALKGSPKEAELYRVLAEVALERLPVSERKKIAKLVK